MSTDKSAAAMKASEALREFISKYVNNNNEPTFLPDLIALISEHYVAKEEVDKMVSERLREELMAYDKFLSNTYWGVSHLVKRDEAVDEYLKTRESHD